MKILVIGAGQIGSRHVQGLAGLPSLREVVVVDPQAESRDRTASRWRDIEGHADKKLTLLAEPPLSGTFDAAIVATGASGRLRHFETLAALGVRHVLAEKLLFQSLAELEAGVALEARAGLAIYANYVYRYAAPWAALRTSLAGASFHMDVKAGDIGLATNLPHWLDLFEYLAASENVALDVVALYAIYPSKRGGGLLECSGRLAGRAANGCSIKLDFTGEPAAPFCRIETKAGWISLNEASGAIAGPLAQPDWVLETPMVSRITMRAIPDILAGTTPLPRLAATVPMNRLLLRALGKAMLGSFAPDSIVPIT